MHAVHLLVLMVAAANELSEQSWGSIPSLSQLDYRETDGHYHKNQSIDGARTRGGLSGPVEPPGVCVQLMEEKGGGARQTFWWTAGWDAIGRAGRMLTEELGCCKHERESGVTAGQMDAGINDGERRHVPSWFSSQRPDSSPFTLQTA